MKFKLTEYFGDEIIFGHLDGKKNEVTLIPNAKKILARFHENNKESDDIESQKKRIVEAAGNIIKSEIKALESNNTYLP